MNTDAREHKLQKQCDQHDVSNGFEGDNQTVDHMLQAFGSVDGTQWTQHSEDTEHLKHWQHLGFVRFGAAIRYQRPEINILFKTNLFEYFQIQILHDNRQEDWNERYDDDKHVQHIEGIATECAFMQEHTIRD